MMDIGSVRVDALEGVVVVRMRMGFRAFAAAVIVLVMLVVDVSVIVLQRLVKVGVSVLDPDEKPVSQATGNKREALSGRVGSHLDPGAPPRPPPAGEPPSS
jgi:hypothetical protein